MFLSHYHHSVAHIPNDEKPPQKAGSVRADFEKSSTLPYGEGQWYNKENHYFLTFVGQKHPKGEA